MEENRTNSIYNFIFGKPLIKDIKPSQYEIDRELIKSRFPDAKWRKEKVKSLIGEGEYETDVLDFDSFYIEIVKKYPMYRFDKIVTNYKDSIYYDLILKNVFDSAEFEPIRVGFFESDIANLIRAFEEIKKSKLKLIKGYKGIRDLNKFEIGIQINKNKKIFNDIDKNVSIEYNINLNKKDIKVYIGKASPTYITLFSNMFYNTVRFTVTIQNLTVKDKNKILDFIHKLEIALNLKLYTDYQDMVEFSKYIPKRKNPSKSDTFYIKPIRGNIDNNLKLYYLNPIIVTYMQNTIRTDFIPFRFLSYYHILEFYFIECYEKYIQEIYDKASTVNFDDISFVLDTANKYRSEEKMLKLVLIHYINLIDFKKYFSIRKNIPQNKISHEIVLPGISIKDEETFHETLSKRIYILRNAIVHSKNKKTKIKPLYFTKIDQGLISALYIEIRLIKWIAEKIIESNIKDINK